MNNNVFIHLYKMHYTKFFNWQTINYLKRKLKKTQMKLIISYKYNSDNFFLDLFSFVINNLKNCTNFYNLFFHFTWFIYLIIKT